MFNFYEKVIFYSLVGCWRSRFTALNMIVQASFSYLFWFVVALQMLNNIDKIKDSKAKEYRKKFCPREEWVRFYGCHVYFHLPRQSL